MAIIGILDGDDDPWVVDPLLGETVQPSLHIVRCLLQSLSQAAETNQRSLKLDEAYTEGQRGRCCTNSCPARRTSFCTERRHKYEPWYYLTCIQYRRY
jgi:hypothetical protein